MCKSCGCGASRIVRFAPGLPVMADLDAQAQNNTRSFNDAGTWVVNLISAPGSGKTSLLAATLPRLKSEFSLGVMVGDVATDNDAKRLSLSGVKCVQITTGNVCHLDATMIARAWAQWPDPKPQILFIENVGNLVCPVEFDLGHHVTVILLSVTEGEDKPQKYPAAFAAADCVVLSKCDLLPYVPFDIESANRHVRALAPTAAFCQVAVAAVTADIAADIVANSAPTIESWLDWLRHEYARAAQGGNNARSAQT